MRYYCFKQSAKEQIKVPQLGNDERINIPLQAKGSKCS